MSVAILGGVVAAGVGAAGASGAFGGAAVSPVNETEAQILADQQSMVGPLAQTNAKWDPFMNAAQQSIAYTNLEGAPATAAIPARTVWYGPNGQVANAPQYVSVADPSAVGANTLKTGENVSGSSLTTQQVAPGWTSKTTPATPATPAVVGEIPELQQVMPQLNTLQNQLAASTAASQIGEVQNLGPAALAAIKSYNPAQTQLADTLAGQAQTQLATNGQLDPATQMALAQNVNQANAARGTATGPASADAVAFYQTQAMQANRAANQQLASNVISQQSALYGDPFMQILGRSSGISVPGANTGNTGPTALNTQSQQSALNTLGALGYNAQNASNVGAFNTQMGSIGALTGNSTALGNILNQIGAGNVYNATNPANTYNAGAATTAADASFNGGSVASYLY